MRIPFLILAGLLAFVPPVAQAQTPDSVPSAITAVRHPPAQIRLWHVGAAVGGIALLSVADRTVQRFVVEHRTQQEQDIAVQWQKWGEGTIPVGITLGTLGAGLILREPDVTRTGARLATTLAVVTIIGRGMKKGIGRARPSAGTDQYTFDPLSTYDAFPSGHTTVAFAISTTLADAIDRPWADAGLYTLAGGTLVSRVVGNHHWLSDVVGAAVLGTTVAKVVDGKWRIFGLRPPEFLVGPDGSALRWTAPLPR